MASTCLIPTLPALLLGAVLGLGWSEPVRAQAGLADPTRPPALLTGPARPGGAVQATTASQRTTADHTRAPQPASAAVPQLQSPQLQSLQLPRDGSAPSALIDGRLLRIGERLGEWTVQAIERDAVWLRRGRAAPQRLALLPALNPGTPPSRPADTEASPHLAATAATTRTVTVAAPRDASPRKEP